MRPIRITTTLTAANAQAISSANSYSAAGAVTFNGSEVSGGIVSFATPRPIAFDSTSNENGKVFTFTGTVLQGGGSVSEALTATLSSGRSVNFFFTVTGITVGSATAGAVKFGTDGTGGSNPIPVDYLVAPFAVGVAAVLTTGSANWTLQLTNDNVFDSTATPVWIDDATHTSKSASFSAAVTNPCRAMRIKINSGTGTVTTTFVQGIIG